MELNVKGRDAYLQVVCLDLLTTLFPTLILTLLYNLLHLLAISVRFHKSGPLFLLILRYLLRVQILIPHYYLSTAHLQH